MFLATSWTRTECILGAKSASTRVGVWKVRWHVGRRVQRGKHRQSVLGNKGGEGFMLGAMLDRWRMDCEADQTVESWGSSRSLLSSGVAADKCPLGRKSDEVMCSFLLQNETLILRRDKQRCVEVFGPASPRAED